jgi:hypothetical protein
MHTSSPADSNTLASLIEDEYFVESYGSFLTGLR